MANQFSRTHFVERCCRKVGCEWETTSTTMPMWGQENANNRSRETPRQDFCQNNTWTTAFFATRKVVANSYFVRKFVCACVRHAKPRPWQWWSRTLMVLCITRGCWRCWSCVLQATRGLPRSHNFREARRGKCV